MAVRTVCLPNVALTETPFPSPVPEMVFHFGLSKTGAVAIGRIQCGRDRADETVSTRTASDEAGVRRNTEGEVETAGVTAAKRRSEAIERIICERDGQTRQVSRRLC